MRGTIKKTGGRNLSGHENELEEYFAELEAGELDTNDPARLTKGPSGLTATEEARRLTAYIIHLREKVAELQRVDAIRSRAAIYRPFSPIVGFTVIIGLATSIGILARHVLGRR